MLRETQSFEQLVVDVLDSLPPKFAKALQNIEIIIEPRLSKNVRRKHGFHSKETVYGLYEGVPLPERSVYDTYMPDTITLFQEAFEEDFLTPEELQEEVRRTVLHELAHHFGISDERLKELGAY